MLASKLRIYIYTYTGVYRSMPTVCGWLLAVSVRGGGRSGLSWTPVKNPRKQQYYEFSISSERSWKRRPSNKLKWVTRRPRSARKFWRPLEAARNRRFWPGHQDARRIFSHLLQTTVALARSPNFKRGPAQSQFLDPGKTLPPGDRD